MDALEICNKLRSEASGVATSGIPRDVFPQKMQQMILDLARTENYSIEFTATSLISAMAAAVGNSCYIRIKGNWITSPILYVILVGRPGVGKTPPLNFAYKPLHDIDTEEHHKFKALKNEYAAIVENQQQMINKIWAQAGMKALAEIADIYPRMTSIHDSSLFDDSFAMDFINYGDKIIYCAMYLYIGYVNEATNFAESQGGGGSDTKDWGREKDEDEIEWIRRCLRQATRMIKPRKGKGLSR